jgi:hypothetical protein
MDQYNYFMPIDFMFSCFMHLYANFEMCILSAFEFSIQNLPTKP